MKKIIIVRHSFYPERDGDVSLSPMGITFGGKLAKAIDKETDGLLTIIWSSTTKRGQETAKIINKELKNPGGIISFPELVSSNGAKPQIKWLEEQINQFNGNVLVIITHVEYIIGINDKWNLQCYESGYAAEASGFVIAWEEGPKLIKQISFRS